eukprot:Skav226751  [mRNA]  locus=scaffold3942:85191:88239:- [translate_table: standard]
MNNLNADSLSFLQRNLRNVQRTRREASQQQVEESGVTVHLPRESRRKRSCGTAFVLLKNLRDAKKAVDRLDGCRLHEKSLVVDLLERSEPKDEDGSSKHRVIVFSPHESVEHLGQRIIKRDFQHDLRSRSPVVHAQFQAARRAEEKMESENVRKALSESLDEAA